MRSPAVPTRTTPSRPLLSSWTWHGMASATYRQMEKHEKAFRVYYGQVVDRHARGEGFKAQAALGHDGQLSRAEQAALAGQARAQQAASDLAGITPAQALKLMRGGLPRD